MVTADEVLEARKQYKRMKAQYRSQKQAQPATEPPAKKERKPRAQRARTEKELANDARLKARAARAKEIRAATPDMKWIDAVKQASAEMKA